jgi:predicted aldo/keto reductase-like oxidoreductase
MAFVYIHEIMQTSYLSLFIVWQSNVRRQYISMYTRLYVLKCDEINIVNSGMKQWRDIDDVSQLSRRGEQELV